MGRKRNVMLLVVFSSVHFVGLSILALGVSAFDYRKRGIYPYLRYVSIFVRVDTRI
ncbi:MAG: hypothetical protein ACI35P_06935 [Bacillus sp. (in: firmicutes)]